MQLDTQAMGDGFMFVLFVGLFVGLFVRLLLFVCCFFGGLFLFYLFFCVVGFLVFCWCGVCWRGLLGLLFFFLFFFSVCGFFIGELSVLLVIFSLCYGF